jgi:hypothetical protein
MSGGECTCAGESLQGDRTEWIARLPVEVSRLGLVGADEPCASVHADARCHIPWLESIPVALNSRGFLQCLGYGEALVTPECALRRPYTSNVRMQFRAPIKRDSPPPRVAQALDRRVCVPGSGQWIHRASCRTLHPRDTRLHGTSDNRSR